MSFARFYRYKDLYFTPLPIIVAYTTIIGINTGNEANTMKKEKNSTDLYSTLIGYTGIGMITGLTYPISFPLLGVYALYKSSK
jgi:hypothetical protein